MPTNGTLAAPSGAHPPKTPSRHPGVARRWPLPSRRRRLPQHAVAACASGAQPGVARQGAVWTCRSRWATVASQGLLGARASGPPVARR
jgi:hypothetical protein